MASGSKKYKRKDKRKEEVAEKKRALSSPGSLQICYRDLRRREAVEDKKSLSEFLRWSRLEKVAIFTKPFYEYVAFNKNPTVEENAKFWCPALETACMIPENTAEEFYEFRNDMYVDAFEKEAYSDAVAQVITREKAFRMQRLMLEPSSHVEIQNALVVKAEDEQIVALESDFVGAEQIDVKVDIDQTDAKAEAKEVENASQSHFDDVKVDQTDAKAEAKEVEIASQSHFVDVELDRTDAKTEVKQEELLEHPHVEDAGADDDIEGWKFVVNKKEKSVPLNNLIMQVLEEVRKIDGVQEDVKKLRDEVKKLDGFGEDVKTLKEDMKTLKEDMKTLKEDVKEAHKAILENGESIVRLSLGSFLGKLGKKSNQEICIPIYGKRIRYTPFLPLEQMAALCLKSAGKPRSTPLEAEIDIVVKIIDENRSERFFSPPRSQHRHALSTCSDFTSLSIGENTRSVHLCNAKYAHPGVPECSTSSKLLYKFV